jgi:hypothetical protein
MKTNNLLILTIVLVSLCVLYLTYLKNNTELFSGGASHVPCTFDANAYSNYYPDLQNAFHGNADQLKQHYKEYGINEGRTPCGSTFPTCNFNTGNYSSYYPDLQNAFHGNTDQLKQHYKAYGINEGRIVCK